MQKKSAISALCSKDGASDNLGLAISLQHLSDAVWCVSAALVLYLARHKNLAEVPVSEAHELLHILGGSAQVSAQDNEI